MASRMMHLAIAALLLRQRSMGAPDRFRLGAMLPDAVVSGNSHWKLRFPDGRRTYDLRGFRQRFGELLQTDSLYLGYYMHLVQDLLFRHFVYDEHHWDPAPQGNAERLHNDYALLNRYVIDRYVLPPVPCLPVDLAQEPLLAGCEFDLDRFAAACQTDFISRSDGAIFFFTPEMADSYIMCAAEQCLRELDALQAGCSCMDQDAQAWG